MVRRYLIPFISFIGTTFVMIGKKIQIKTAYPKSFPIRAVEQSTNEIIFYFKSVKGPFRIYREGRLIYEGTDEVFNDRELAEETTYLYTIEIGTRRGSPERLKIQTSTAVESRELENVVKNCVQTTIISRSLVAIEWDPIEGVEEYLIYRNGKRIGKVEEPLFVDRWVRSQVEYTYQVYAERPLAWDQDLDDESRVTQKKVKEQNVAMEKFQMTKVLEPLEDILNAGDRSLEKREWKLLYKTFVSKNWIKNSDQTSPYRYFKGEGRGFDPTSEAYRSMAEVVVTADGSEVKLNKGIGKTNGYGMLRNLKGEVATSDDGIFLEEVEIEKEKASFVLRHSVEDPLVDLPAVDYQVWAEFFQSGFYDITGVHEQAPNHEIYLKHGIQRSWTVLHQSKDVGGEFAAPMHWRMSNFK